MKTHLLAALIGSILTFLLMRGVASTPAPEPLPNPDKRNIPVDRASAPALHAPDPGAGDRVAALEKQLDRAQLERALAVGQLKRHEGAVQEWPANPPAVWRPEGFEAFLEERVAAIPDAEIVAVDCEEYPCVALVRSRSPAEDWEDRLMPVHGNLEAAGFGDSLHVIGMGHVTELDTDKGPLSIKLYGFAVAPGDGDEMLVQRVKYRTSSAMEDADAELREP